MKLLGHYTREALKKLESWKTWSRGAAVTAEDRLQCSFLTIFSARSAAPRDIEVSNASRSNEKAESRDRDSPLF